MNNATILIVVMAAALAGIFFCAAAIGLYFAVRWLREFTDALKKVATFLDLINGEKTVATMRAFQSIAENMPLLIANLRSVHGMLESFVRAVVQQPVAEQVVSGKPPAPGGGGRVYEFDEADAAAREAERDLRRRGIETNDINAPSVDTVDAIHADS